MKTKLLFITLAFIGWSNFANAQTPVWEWAKDTSTMALGGMVTDASGNLFVSNGFGEGFLVKYDNDGIPIWAKSAVGDLESPPAVQAHSNGIALDPFGNILVTGIFTSDTMILGTTIFQRVSTVDMFIAKFDNNGTFLWAKTEAIGNVGNVGFQVTSDASGNAIVVGSYSAPTLTVGITTFINPCTSGGGCPSMLVIKYDENDGSVFWAKSSFASMGTSYCYSVVTDDLNNVYVGGDFSSTGNIRNGIVKYNSVGDTLWVQNYGGWFINMDAAGNLYSGYDKVANDGIVKKYDASNGSVLWSTTATGNTSNKGVSMATDGVNMYYFGLFRSTSITFGTFTLTHAGAGSDDDFFIVKYDNTGTVIWAKAVGGTSWDALKGAAIDPAGNAFVGGYFLSPTLDFDAIPMTVLGIGYNTFFAKLGNNPIILGTPKVISSDSDNNFNIYPNPTNDQLFLEILDYKNTTLEISNMEGRLMQQVTLENSKTMINTETLSKGIYLITVKSPATISVQKLVKN